jgi:hypothetical protein
MREPAARHLGQLELVRSESDGDEIGLDTDTPELVPAPPPRARARQLPLLGDVVAFPRAD